MNIMIESYCLKMIFEIFHAPAGRETACLRCPYNFHCQNGMVPIFNILSWYSFFRLNRMLFVAVTCCPFDVGRIPLQR